MAQDLANLVFDFVAKIPRGKVATYGQIAVAVGTGPRVVGNILHKNEDPEKFPCHRVVNARGMVAPSYAFGGADVQRRKLEREGIVFTKNKIDLKKYLF